MRRPVAACRASSWRRRSPSALRRHAERDGGRPGVVAGAVPRRARRAGAGRAPRPGDLPGDLARRRRRPCRRSGPGSASVGVIVRVMPITSARTSPTPAIYAVYAEDLQTTSYYGAAAEHARPLRRLHAAASTRAPASASTPCRATPTARWPSRWRASARPSTFGDVLGLHPRCGPRTPSAVWDFLAVGRPGPRRSAEPSRAAGQRSARSGGGARPARRALDAAARSSARWRRACGAATTAASPR